MPKEEGTKLIKELIDHCTQRQYILTVKWQQPGDLVSRAPDRVDRSWVEVLSSSQHAKHASNLYKSSQARKKAYFQQGFRARPGPETGLKLQVYLNSRASQYPIRLRERSLFSRSF